MTIDNHPNPPGAGLRRAVGWPVLVLTVLGLAILLNRNWSDFVAAFRGANWVLLALAALTLTVGHGLSALLSSRLSEAAGEPVPVSTAFRILSIGGLAKYVPGGVWEFASRYGLGKAAGMNFRESLGLWLQPMLLLLTVSGVWACFAAAFVGYELPGWVFLAAGAVFIGLSTPGPRAWLSARMGIPSKPPGTAGTWIISLVIASAGVLLSAGHGLLVLQAIEPNSGIGLVGAIAAFVGSWVLGFIVLPIPGGFGIREGALVIALSPWLSPGPAIAVAAASRIASITSDLVAAAIALPTGMTRDE